MQQPTVTVAIPTYNRADYLKQAVESALNQTYRQIEVIIADNASTDQTREVAGRFKDHRVHYFRHSENKGLVYNWNFCLARANGELFLMLSDDDILAREAIEKMQAGFQNPAVVMAYCGVIFYNETLNCENLIKNKGPGAESGHEFIVGRLNRKRVWAPSAALIRTNILRRAGGYPAVGTALDIASCFAAIKGGEVYFVPDPLVRYRVHENNISNVNTYNVKSHEDLINWAGREGGFLYDYRDLVRRYCVWAVNCQAYSAAQSGKKEVFSFAAALLRQLQPGLAQELKLLAYRLPHLHLGLKLLRALKERSELIFCRPAPKTR